MAQAIVDQLTAQTVDCLLEAAFAEDPGFAGQDAATLARHPLMSAGLRGHRGVVAVQARLAVPVIGLGASAPSYYGAVGERLGCETILPEHAGVANAEAQAPEIRRTEFGLNVFQTIVTAIAAALFEADATRWQVEFVVNDENFFGRDFVKIG